MCFKKIIHLKMLPVLLLAAVPLSCSNLDTDLNDALNSEGVKYYAYAASSSSNKIIGYILDPATGTLTINGSTTINDPTALATDPSGKYLYAASSGTNTITAYSIGIDGELTSSGSPESTGAYPASIAVTQSGKYLYVMNDTDNTISAYSIDPSTGGLTPVSGGSIASSGSILNHRQIAADPAGKWLFATNYDDKIYPYDINSATGALSALSAITVPDAIFSSLAIAPSGAFAYIATWNKAPSPSSIIAYSIDSSTGALSSIQNIGASSTLDIFEITIHPSGKYLYASAEYNDTMAIAYSIGTDGKLTLINQIDTGSGNGISSIAIDQTGKFLFITNGTQNKITVLSIDSKGALTYLKKVTVGSAKAIVFVKK